MATKMQKRASGKRVGMYEQTNSTKQKPKGPLGVCTTGGEREVIFEQGTDRDKLL